MPITVRPVTAKRDLETFIRMPWSVYRGPSPDPAWVPPLLQERRDFLNPKKNPFFEHGEAQLFLATRDRKGKDVVGRISAHVNYEHDRVQKDGVGFFGFFDSLDEDEIAEALLHTAEQWVKGRGYKTIRGPFNFTINDDCGVLIEGNEIPPYPMMSHTPAYYGGLIERQGYAKAKDLWSWGYAIDDMPAPLLQVADAARRHPGVRIRPIDMKNLESEIRLMMGIFNEAWSKNWGFVPLTEHEILHMANDLKMFVEPDLCLIAEIDGEPAGISFALPNIHEHIKDLDGKLLPFGFLKLIWRVKFTNPKSARLVALGIRKKFRGKGIGGMGLSVLLYTEMSERAKVLGITDAEAGWTLEDNDKINRGISLMGAKVHRKHRIYEKPLAIAEE